MRKKIGRRRSKRQVTSKTLKEKRKIGKEGRNGGGEGRGGQGG